MDLAAGLAGTGSLILEVSNTRVTSVTIWFLTLRSNFQTWLSWGKSSTFIELVGTLSLIRCSLFLTARGGKKQTIFLSLFAEKKPDYSRELNSSDGIQEIVCDLWRVLTAYSVSLWTEKNKIWCPWGKYGKLLVLKELDETLRRPKITHYYKAARENGNFLWMGVALSCAIAIR